MLLMYGWLMKRGCLFNVYIMYFLTSRIAFFKQKRKRKDLYMNNDNELCWNAEWKSPSLTFIPFHTLFLVFMATDFPRSVYGITKKKSFQLLSNITLSFSLYSHDRKRIFPIFLNSCTKFSYNIRLSLFP